jgi:FG-GAP repeat
MNPLLRHNLLLLLGITWGCVPTAGISVKTKSKSQGAAGASNPDPSKTNPPFEIQKTDSGTAEFVIAANDEARSVIIDSDGDRITTIRFPANSTDQNIKVKIVRDTVSPMRLGFLAASDPTLAWDGVVLAKPITVSLSANLKIPAEINMPSSSTQQALVRVFARTPAENGLDEEHLIEPSSIDLEQKLITWQFNDSGTYQPVAILPQNFSATVNSLTVDPSSNPGEESPVLLIDQTSPPTETIFTYNFVIAANDKLSNCYLWLDADEALPWQSASSVEPNVIYTGRFREGPQDLHVRAECQRTNGFVWRHHWQAAVAKTSSITDSESVFKFTRAAQELTVVSTPTHPSPNDHTKPTTGNENLPPTFGISTELAGIVGQVLQLDLKASDPNSDPLTFACGNPCPTGLKLKSNGTALWEVKSTSAVTADITASDGSLSTTVKLTLTGTAWSGLTDLNRTNNGEGSGHRFGEKVSFVGDINADGVPDYAVSATGYNLNNYAPGKVYVYSGSNNQELRVVSGVESGSNFGAAITGNFDANGDGYGDFAVGEILSDGVGAVDSNGGAVRIYSGFNGQQISNYYGLETGEHLGVAILAFPDQDNDSFKDLLISAPDTNGAGVDRGSIRLYSGKASGLKGEIWRYTEGIESNARIGNALAIVGDLNQDGVPDIAVGANLANAGGTQRGKVVFLSGKTGAKIFELTGSENNAGFGTGLATISDIDNDGMPELAISEPLVNGSGTARGKIHVYSLNGYRLLYSIEGQENYLNLGAALAVADANQDGFLDLVAGGERFAGGGSERGAAFIFSGYSGMQLQIIAGTADGTHLGHSVAAITYASAGSKAVRLVVGGDMSDNTGKTDNGTSMVFGSQ